MEASEHRGPPPRGGGGTGLHRVEPDVVAEILAASDHSTGFSRLELMLNNVIGRLVAVDGVRPRENQG
jgi:hypothetical protein